ncbi:Cytochrome P450 [Niveomyces insectorum RCEF 264]|uniref:Cytochrome P450 n=1 Tax=Niveomyces insectorum RCEF 264 TaxID=1081102 RepID=A0A167Z133_9HYPO|nr:Cytochrome P450 [Niveomyces insectorum RCEF 264]
MTCAAIAALGVLSVPRLGAAADAASWSWTALASTFLIIFSVCWIAVKAYYIFIYPHYVSPYRHLPGPKGGHWFLGHFPGFFAQKYPWSIYVDWVREFPGVPVIRYLTIANNEVLVPLTAEGMKECLMTKCYEFKKTEQWLRMVLDFAGWGIVTFSGDAHRAARRMLSKPFSLANIRKLEPIFNQKAAELCAVMDGACQRGSDDGQSGVIDAIELMAKTTLDIMGLAALGRELSHLQSAGQGTGGKENAAHAYSAEKYDFHDAYQCIVSPSMTGKILLFASGYVNVRWLPLQANREFKRATAFLDRSLRTLIRQRTAEIHGAMRAGTHAVTDSRDILTFIAEESLPGGGGAAEGITEDEFVGNLLQIMVAGHETSATVLTWSAYIFATDHAIQDRVRAEINALLATTPHPTYADLEGGRLHYTDNLLKEVNRVFSPAAVTYREAAHDNLVFQGVPLRKGTVLDVIPAVTHMDPQIWGETVDQFDPSRWEADRLTPAQADPYVFAGFSNGPRICLGKTFAWLEMKLVLVQMVSRFRFVQVEKPFEIESPGLATRPTEMLLRIEKI